MLPDLLVNSSVVVATEEIAQGPLIPIQQNLAISSFRSLDKQMIKNLGKTQESDVFQKSFLNSKRLLVRRYMKISRSSTK